MPQQFRGRANFQATREVFTAIVRFDKQITLLISGCCCKSLHFLYDHGLQKEVCGRRLLFFAGERRYGGGRKWEEIMRHDSGRSGDVRWVVKKHLLGRH